MKQVFPSDWGFVEWSISLAIAGFSVVTAYITKVQLGLWSHRRDILELQNDVAKLEASFRAAAERMERAYEKHPTRDDLDAHIVSLQTSINKLTDRIDGFMMRLLDNKKI